MKKRIALLVIVTILFSFASGCWSRTEVENLAIGTVIAVDKVQIQGKEKYRVATRIVRTGELGLGQLGGGGDRRTSWIISSFGETPFEAGRNMSTRSARRVFLAHSTFVIISEKAAMEGVQDIVDTLLRHRDIRLRNFILITKGEAIDAIQLEAELETLLFEELTGGMEVTAPMVSKTVRVDLKDFASSLALKGRDVAVGKLELFIQPEEANRQEIEQFFGETPDQPSGKSPRLTGSAIFKKDKLVGYMGDWETSGLLHILGDYVRGAVPIKMKDKDVFTFEITRSESEIKSKVEGEDISFDIEIFIEGDIADLQAQKKEGLTPEDLEKMGQAAAKTIQTQVDGAIKIAQEDFGADIFGLGEKLRRQNNREWKKVSDNWREIFPEVNINAKVEVAIRRTGMVSDPLMIE